MKVQPPTTECGQSAMIADDIIRRLRGCTLLKEDARRVAEVLVQCVKPDSVTPDSVTENRYMIWRKGKRTEVISDELAPDAVPGSEHTEYYDGGYLVAESVAPSLVPLIVEAPVMAALLKRYVDDDPCAPGDTRYTEAVALLERIKEVGTK